MSATRDGADVCGQSNGLHYLLRKPALASEPWPLLLFLHGAGERGNPNGSQINLVLKHGPWRHTDDLAVLAPQCPMDKTWPNVADNVNELLKHICDQYRIDGSRCYATGISMGGFGVWAVATASPDLFAALVPICGGFCPPLPGQTDVPTLVKWATVSPLPDLGKLSHIPTWLFHGERDRVVKLSGSTETYKELCRANSDLMHLHSLTTVKEGGHQIWLKVYGDPKLLTWLLQQRRPSPAATPVPDMSVTSPNRSQLGQRLKTRLASQLEPRGPSTLACSLSLGAEVGDATLPAGAGATSAGGDTPSAATTAADAAACTATSIAVITLEAGVGVVGGAAGDPVPDIIDIDGCVTDVADAPAGCSPQQLSVMESALEGGWAKAYKLPMNQHFHKYRSLADVADVADGGAQISTACLGISAVYSAMMIADGASRPLVVMEKDEYDALLTDGSIFQRFMSLGRPHVRMFLPLHHSWPFHPEKECRPAKKLICGYP